MAKGQKRSNREPRKAKQPKAAPAATRSFLETAKRGAVTPFAAKKRPGA